MRITAYPETKDVEITGDNENTAKAIVERIGIEDYRTEFMPEGKSGSFEARLKKPDNRSSARIRSLFSITSRKIRRSDS